MSCCECTLALLVSQRHFAVLHPSTYIETRTIVHGSSCRAMIKIINSGNTSRNILAEISTASCTVPHYPTVRRFLGCKGHGVLNYKCQAERARVPAYAIWVRRLLFSFFEGVRERERERDFIRVTFVRRVFGQPSNSISRSVSSP